MRPLTTPIFKTVISVGLGLLLICSVLLLFGTAVQPATAAPAPPPNLWPNLPPQALVVVTTTIQAAIDAANPGDTVEFTGTYTEEVVINKPLTLRGATPASTIVYDGSITPPANPTIHISNTTGVTITNITLRTVGFLGQNAILVQNSGDVRVIGLTIQDYPTGIEVQRFSAGPTGITITNNLIQSSDGSAGPGIYFLGAGAGAGAIQATVQANQVSGHAPLINAEGLAPSLIVANVLTTTGNSFDGAIRVNQAGTSLIQNNTLIVTAPPTSSTLTGIFVGNTANPTIIQNSIDSQFTFGIETNDSAAPVISNSTISGHPGAGVRVSGSSTPQVFNNSITNNFNGISVGSILSLVTASGNTICQNTTYGLRSSSSYPNQPATGNWWGHNPPLDSSPPTPSDYSPNVDASSPISMALALDPAPALIPVNGSVGITLTMRGGGQNALDGTGITFAASAGSFSTSSASTSNGLATTVYTGTVLGTHTITATDSCGGFITGTVIVAEPVLTATKTANPLPGSIVRPGDAITYTILVTNTGGFTATGVVFSDTIPAYTQLATASVNSGSINASNPISATFDPIPPNGGTMTVTVRVTVTLPLTNGTILSNTGAISYFNGSGNVLTSTNTVTHLVQSSPDITITKTSQPPSGTAVNPGDYITYTIAITNQGDANATGVVVSDTVPANTILVSVDATPNVITTAANPVRGDIALLPAPTGAATLTFTVRVISPLANGTLIANTAQVTSVETTGVITYSNAVTHPVQSAAVLTIAKSAAPPSGSVVTPTDTITYQLVITNVGDDNATGVVITDIIPAYVNYVPGSASAVNGSIITTDPTLRVTAPVLTGTQLNGTQSSIQVTFAVTVTTPLTNNTLISNSGYVSFTTASVITPSNIVTHVVQSSPSLTITKTADPPSGSSVVPGQNITYTLTVTNNGNANATTVIISDTIPQHTSFATASASPGTIITPTVNLLTVESPILAGEGGVLTVTMLVTVTSPLTNGLILTNTADVTAAEVASLTVSNPVTHVVVSSPNLTVTKTATPTGGSAVRPGDYITYTITISNSGDANATGAVVSDTIPANTTLVFSAATGGVSLSGPNPVVGNIGLLPAPNGVEVITLTVQVTSPLANGTIISNTAQITATEVPTITTSQLVTHVVQSSPVLTIAKSAVPASPGPVNPGDVITYTVTVRNIGDANATNVLISDTIPADTTPFGTISFFGSGGAAGLSTQQVGNARQFEAVLLPAPTGMITATFRVTVTRPLTNGTIITNTAQVTSTEVATVTFSNAVTHVVQSAPNITITKTANPPSGPVSPGDTITYTLTVTNIGDAIAPNVIVTDTLPQFVNPVSTNSGTGAIGEAGGLVTWNIGSLTVDLPVTAQIVVSVTTPLTNGLILSNTGYVTHTGASVITPSNTITHVVVSSPSVTYTKFAQPPAGSTLNLSLSPPTQITYTVFVTNNGNANATGLTITDTVPADTGGAGLTPWTPGFLAGNGGVISNTFVVTVNVPLPDLTIITNRYQVSYNEVPGIFDSTSPVSATNVVTHLIRSAPLVTVTKVATPPRASVVTPGDVISYSLLIANSGTATATNFVLTDAIPLNTTYIGGSASSTSGIVTPSTSVLTLTVPALSVSQQVTFTFAVTVNSPLANGTILSNQGVYTFDQAAAVTQTNVVTHLVQSEPVITLTKSATPGHGSTVTPGDTITYTITITNSGSADATGAILTDTVPQYTQYVPGSASPAPASTGPLVWNLGAINGAGGVVSTTFVVSVTSPLTNGLVISNSAVLDIVETAGLSRTNVVTHLVQSTTDITVTKSANPPTGSSVSPGDTITYTIVAANSGTQMATGVVLTDPLPAEINVVSVTGTKTPAPTAGGGLLTWNIGTLTGNEMVTATLVATVTTPLTRGTVISNQAFLLTTQTGLSSTTFVTHTVVSTPLLTLSKSANPPGGTGVIPGQTITYTIAVTNSGDGPATNFQITDTLPISAGLLGGSVSATPGFSTISSTNAVTVNGTLNAGQSMSVTFAVTVSTTAAQGTILSNTGFVSYAESPVISATNAVTHVVLTTPAITLTKSAQPAGPTIDAGQTITYTVVVSNGGSLDANNVVITDFIPANTTFVGGSFTSTLGALSGPDPLQVSIPTLAGGQAATMTFQVTVASPITSGVVISNAAQVSADFLSTVSSNLVTHTVVSTPQLTLVKTNVPANFVVPGTPLVYFLTLRNDGSGPATNIVISDTLPADASVSFHFAPPPTATSVISGSLWQITVPSLQGGGTTLNNMLVILTVNSPLTNGLVITNVASIISDQTPISTSNVVTNIVQSRPELLITKSADPPNGSAVNPGDTITYTIRVEHDLATSTENAANVVITDALPLNTNFVAGSDSLTGGGVNPTSAFTAPNVIGQLDLLPVGDVVTLTFRVVVTSPLADGTIINNVAQVDSSNSTPINSGPVTHTVQSQVDLTFSKSAAPPPGPITPGDTITYTITITNSGSANATGLVITDVAPTYTTYAPGSAASSGSAAESGGVVSFGGNIPGGGGVFTGTFAVSVTNPLTNGLNIVNAAQFSTDQTLVISQTNSVTHTVVSSPVLTLTKSANPAGGSLVNPGDMITYTLSVVNNGTTAATGVVITDLLDANLNFVNANPVASSGPNPLVFNVGNLLAGQTVSYTVRVTVTTPLTNGTLISNAAQVASTEVPTATTSNTVTHTVVATPNLLITKLASPVSGTQVDPGSGINYTIVIVNNGNAPATNLVITDSLPISTTYFSSQVFPPAMGSISGPDPLVATIPNLPGSGGAVMMLFSVNVVTDALPGMVITNVAQVDSSETVVTDTNVVTHIVKAPNLVISKVADPPTGSSVNPGDPITYTVTVTNIGSLPATGVVVTDTLDPNVNFVGATPSQSSGPNPLVFNAGTLFSNQSVSYTIRVTVASPLAAGVVMTNVAQAQSAQTSVVTSTVVTHQVAAVPVLSINKSASPPGGSSVSANSSITYTITVANSGNAPATNVVITDTLPITWVTLATASLSNGGAVAGSNPLTASVGTLNVGSTVTLTVIITTNAVVTDTVITNTAVVVGDTLPVSASQPVTHVITPIPLPNFILTKIADPVSGSNVNPGDPITYTITLMNSGPGDASGVVITDLLDANVTFNTASPAQSSGPNPLVFNVGGLLAGQTVSYTARVTVTNPLSNGTVISNAAQVASTEVPTATQSNAVTHTVVAAPNLSITKLAVPANGSSVNPGDPIIYFVQVTNNGNAPATNLMITDTLPISTVFFFDDLIPNIGTVAGPDPLVATIPSLAGSGGTVLFRFVVTVTNNAPAGLIIPNQAQVSSNETAITNTNTVTHLVGSPPVSNLAISKIADPVAGSSLTAGGSITYTIRVTNTGTTPQTGVSVFDLLDGNTTPVFSSTTPSVPVAGSNPVIATWPTLAAGEMVTMVLRVDVAGGLPDGTIVTNSATGFSNQSPLVATGPVTHVINSLPTPNLVIAKLSTPASGSQVSQGAPITYTITVENNGAATANSVVISDTLDPNVTLVTSNTTTGTVSGSNLLQVSGFNLAVGERVTVTLGVTVTGNMSGTIINNTASVTSPQILALQTSGLVTHIITSTANVPNLVIAKAATPASGSVVEPGEMITYTITVQNNGTATANNTVITDSLPLANVSYVTATLSNGGAVGGPNPLVGTAGNLAAGNTVTMTVVVTVNNVVSGTVISNAADTAADTLAVQSSAAVTHVVSNTVVAAPSFTLSKSANPAGGSTVTQGNIINYTIVVTNSGGTASGFVLTDTIPTGTGYVAGSVSTNFGSGSLNGSQLVISSPTFTGGLTLTASFQVTVTTNLTTTISNQVIIDSDQTAIQNSNVVTHAVQGTVSGSSSIYLPIIYKDFDGGFVVLQWDNVEPVRDKVSNNPGAAGICFPPSSGIPPAICDGRTDGVFLLTVNIGSSGPKVVTSVRLVSSQGVEWNTLNDGVNPVLALYNNGFLNSQSNGSVFGALFNSGLVTIKLYASDDAGLTRFPADTYDYTVIINFADGTSMTGATRVF